MRRECHSEARKRQIRENVEYWRRKGKRKSDEKKEEACDLFLGSGAIEGSDSGIE